jgi:hypothetical protein
MVAAAAYWHGRYVQEFETARKWRGVDFDEYVVNHRRPLLRLAYLLTGDAHHAEDSSKQSYSGRSATGGR